MKYFRSDRLNRWSGGTTQDQWVEILDDGNTVTRWINFIGEGVHPSDSCGRKILISQCAFATYPNTVSKDQFEMMYQMYSRRLT